MPSTHARRPPSYRRRVADDDVTFPGAQAPTASTRIDAHGIGSPPTSGATPAPRRCCASTAASTSPAPTTPSPRCSPPAGGASSAGTSAATATATAPRCTRGTPTCATPSPSSTTSARPAGAGRRALQGRRHDDPARRRPAVPDRQLRQPRRHPLPEPDPRRRRAHPDEDDGQRGRRLARAPPAHGDRRAQAGHARRAGRAAGPHEPAAVAGLAALPGVGRRPRDDDGWRWKIDPTMRFGGFGPWRPEWTLLRLPGLADAVPRRPRPPARGDGLGHGPSGCCRTCRPAGAARSSTTSATSCTSRRPSWSPAWCSTTSGAYADGRDTHAVELSTTGSRSPCTTCGRATGRPAVLHGLGEAAPTTCRRG